MVSLRDKVNDMTNVLSAESSDYMLGLIRLCGSPCGFASSFSATMSFLFCSVM